MPSLLPNYFWDQHSTTSLSELELAKVYKNQLQAEFPQVRVYVHAAGLVPNDVKHGYRSGKTMQSLQSFWQEYFSQAGASLEGFGSPSLTTDLR